MSDHTDDAFMTHLETAAQPAPAPMRRPLSKAEIIRAHDLQTEWVSVPEWGGDVRVRGLTAGQRDQLEAAMIDKKGQPAHVRLGQFRSRMLMLSVIDEQGFPVFEEGDIPALMNKSVKAVERVLKVARGLSNISDEDLEELVGE